jgi:hypothetical protein
MSSGWASSSRYDSGAQGNSITNLTTPYGVTSFGFGALSASDRFTEITLPTGGRHL